MNNTSKKVLSFFLVILGIGSIFIGILTSSIISSAGILFIFPGIVLILISFIMFVTRNKSHKELNQDSDSIDAISNKIKNQLIKEEKNSKPKTCPYCGGVVPVGGVECDNCGATIDKF